MGELLESLVPWGTEVIVWAQSLGNGFLESVALFFTFLGNEEFYLVMLPLVYWCIHKPAGVALAFLSMLSAWVNSAIKFLFAFPRPSDPRIRIPVPPSDPSFPSGHAQNAVAVWVYLAWRFRHWLFWVVAVLLMSGTLSLVGIVEAQRDAGMWFVFPGILAFGIYFVCGIAENNRNPFDLPEAEAELVAGFHTEYSGMKFAMFYLAEYINMMVVSSLAVIFFFGGWLRPFPNLEILAFLDVIPPFFWFYGKMLGFIFLYIWFRGTFPRYRFDQLMQVGWKWLLPLSLANIAVIALGVLLLKG